MPNICPRYSKCTTMVSPSPAQEMHKVCPRYAQYIPKIFPRYALDMQKICPKYIPDMPKLSIFKGKSNIRTVASVTTEQRNNGQPEYRAFQIF